MSASKKKHAHEQGATPACISQALLNDPAQLAAFQQRVWEQGAAQWRDLPWRNVDDPYAVLVSEVMLQQTQVPRVLKKWERFMALFPTIDALAAADTATVLSEWQGLGYNRRALALKRTADICSAERAGQLPSTLDELLALPGIGKATAAGVLAFAWNKPSCYLETNVRSVFIHELFSDATEAVRDRDLEPLVEATCSQDDPRGWYYALLDYGAFLKRSVPNPSRRSAGHATQSAFEGSRRQKRAELLRLVLDEPGIAEGEAFVAFQQLERDAGRPEPEIELFDSLVSDLVAEGFFRREGDLLLP